MKVLSVPEIAKLLNKTETAIRLDLSRGKIPCRKFGRKTLVLEEDVEKFVKLLPGTSVEKALKRSTVQVAD